ncbi:MAG: peptidase, partial [Lachnospiraceae bacterium]|nr:peptidase [Lachnospiraceae bacterium]
MEYVWIGIGVIVLAILFSGIRLVPQTWEFVVERLGKYHCTWNAGLHYKVPFIDRIMKRMTVKEKVLDTPPQPV